MDITLLIAALLIPLWLNIKATLAVRRDPLSERSQKIAQIILVWALPILGAIVVLAMHRPQEKAPGKYYEEKEVGDDYAASGSAGRRAVSEALDGD